MTHVYAFGSVVRGDFDVSSDIDLLAIASAQDGRFDPEKYSRYTRERVRQIWEEGNAFAWHLHLESKLLYSSDGKDFIQDLGKPSEYRAVSEDCARFRAIFLNAKRAIEAGSPSTVFEFSVIFLALRNIATFYSLAHLPCPQFGRDAALAIGEHRLSIRSCVYNQLRHARILATRGLGAMLPESARRQVVTELAECETWINSICEEVAHD